jgi:hypothetical protein
MAVKAVIQDCSQGSPPSPLTISYVACFERLAVSFQRASSEQYGITAFTAIAAATGPIDGGDGEGATHSSVRLLCSTPQVGSGPPEGARPIEGYAHRATILDCTFSKPATTTTSRN